MTHIGDNKEKELRAVHHNNGSETSQVGNLTKNTVRDSPPMAVLPLSSSAKLDQEPNPFEQSFGGQSSEEKSNKLKLPPVASITSPAVTKSSVNNNLVIAGGVLPKEVANQFTWDTLRTGPLSPSMLQGPANPDDYYTKPPLPPTTSHLNSYSTTRTSYTSQGPPQQQQQNELQYIQQPIKTEQTQKRPRALSQADSMDSNESVVATSKSKRGRKAQPAASRRRSSNITANDDSDDDEDQPKKNKSKSSSKEPEDDEKRKNFLERNRIAALKCRQRKKQWLNNLQAKVEFLSSDNDRLQMQSESLKEEIVNLKTLLLAHKECPVAQSNGFHASAIQKGGMPSMLGGNNMYGNLNRSNTLQPTTNPIQPPLTSTSTSAIPRYTRPQEMENTSNTTAGGGGGGGTSGIIRF